ncbi:phage portal protein [Limisalsivibrio acetivorans]|uniref:phage portal protein n=1 Tax=Limisalsivibrio acetivorans TaxID=1304888 RepID=UPI0003B5618C|nr:phage portal protein [Limisalsivibrio acetivorans]
MADVVHISDYFKGSSYSDSAGRMWVTPDLTAEEEIDNHLPTLISRSRALCRNDVAGGIIENIVTNVIGTGLTLDVTLDAELLNITDEQANSWARAVERRFKLWAKSQDADNEARKSFAALQQLGFTSQLRDGDAFALLTNYDRPGSISTLRVGLIDASRVGGAYSIYTSSSGSGIIKDKNGTPAYVQMVTPEGNERKIKIHQKETGLRNIVHSYVELRPGQPRGLPFITSIIQKLRKLEKYSDAELGAAVISAFFVLAFKKTPSKGGPTPPSFKDIIGNTKETDNPTTGSKNLHLEEGQQVDLEEGEELDFVRSDRPNSGYSAFIEAMYREVAISLNIPYELLVKQFGRSYSASRGAIHEAFKFFLKLRENFADEFCQPIYERWLYEEVAEGRISAPGFFTDPLIRRLWCGTRWIGPPKGILDEYKEANASKVRIETGISTRKKEAVNYDGGNIEDVHKQQKREKEMKKELEENIDE